MSVVICGAEVPITLPPGIEPVMFSSMLKTYKPFTEWCRNVGTNLEIRGLTVQSVDYFGTRIGFLKFSAEAYSRVHGGRVPGIVFMRGGSIAVLLVLEDKVTHTKYVVLTEQARVPIGKGAFLEIPAGMIDDNGDVTGVALREVEEETGIELKRSELCNLGSYYLSPGGSDELLTLYYTERRVDEGFIRSLEDKLAGVGEHERIVVRVKKFAEAIKELSDGKSVLAMLLYNQKQRIN